MMKSSLATIVFAAMLAACSTEQPSDTESRDLAAGANVTENFVSASSASEPVARPPSRPAGNVLTLEGLGDLRIGQPIPEGSEWAERGAQTSDRCRIVSSPEVSGVYAIVEDGKVRRITAGLRATIMLADKVGVGSTEEQVRDRFAGFRAEAHKYVAAPAKYLTGPNADSGDPAFRFEIGEDGKVSLVHVGTMPVLGYVEGCA